MGERTAWEQMRCQVVDWALFRPITIALLLSVLGGGLTSALALTDAGFLHRFWVGAVGGLAAVVVFLFVLCLIAWPVSLLRQRNEARVRSDRYEADQVSRAQFCASCEAWCVKIERFLDVRAALEPAYPGPPGLTGAMQWARVPKTDAAVLDDQKRADVQRETVSLYIANHADEGTRMFDCLIIFRTIVDKTRPHIHRPRDISEIRDGLDSIRVAVSRFRHYE